TVRHHGDQERIRNSHRHRHRHTLRFGMRPAEWRDDYSVSYQSVYRYSWYARGLSWLGARRLARIACAWASRRVLLPRRRNLARDSVLALGSGGMRHFDAFPA